MNRSCTSRPPREKIRSWSLLLQMIFAFLMAGFASALAFAQSSSSLRQETISLEGIVRNAEGKAVGDASVVLLQNGQSSGFETKTKVDGSFLFSDLATGVYTLRAEKSEWGAAVAESLSLSAGQKKRIDLVLGTAQAGGRGPSSASSTGQTSSGSMELADQPSFTVAGMTDWNNVGLHASGTHTRTSEALARDTLALKSGTMGEGWAANSEEMANGEKAFETEKTLRAALATAPDSFEANHKLGEFYCQSKKYKEAIPLLSTASQIDSGNIDNAYDLALAYAGNGELDRAREQGRKILASADSAEAHRLVGDLDERLGDPLGAVREYEQATRRDASEQNYFQWGTELLLHRAAQPAVEVFTTGLTAHPDSARILTGLGAALFAARAYDQAARRLCEASDLKPADPAPYFFLGKMEKAAPENLPCSEEKLARFVADQPGNALGNYYYGLILWKRAKGSENQAELARVRIFLEKAVSLDPRLGEAYLQLGILEAESGEFVGAVGAYQKAIAVAPQLGEAHYRLSLAYQRIGDEAKAHREMQTYKQIEKADADALERQERELRQFLIILKDQPAGSAPH